MLFFTLRLPTRINFNPNGTITRIILAAYIAVYSLLFTMRHAARRDICGCGILTTHKIKTEITNDRFTRKENTTLGRYDFIGS
jgi:hypothetical protein